jgi:hypothetical protein
MNMFLRLLKKCFFIALIFNSCKEMPVEKGKADGNSAGISRDFISSSDMKLIKKFGYPYYIGEIIPTPKKALYRDAFLDLADIKNGRLSVCVVLSKKPSRQALAAAELLQNRFSLVIDKKIPIFREGKKELAYKNVILIGDNKLSDSLISEFQVEISNSYPGKQGYVLKFIEKNGVNYVLCKGSDEVGSYYAVSSLNQLFKIENAKIFLRKADLIDWPSFINGRTVCAKRANPSVLDWMAEYKLNALFVNYGGAVDWFELRPGLKKSHLNLCKYANQNGIVEIGYQINPYSAHNNCRDIKISDPNDMKDLIEHYRLLLKSGVRKIYLMADDWAPSKNREFILKYSEDREQFKTYAESHVFMCNAVYDALSKEYPDLEMYFTPSYYSIQHLYDLARTPEIAKEYLSSLSKGLNPNIRIIMCGPYVRSGIITDKDVKAMEGLLNGRTPYIWDNTWGGYATGASISKKSHHDDEGSIFKPFSTKYPKGYLDFIVYHNAPVDGRKYSERARIVSISISDFFWNPEAYDPEASLRKAILSYVGPGMDENLIYFGDWYDRVVASLTSANSLLPQKIIIEDSFEGKRDWGFARKGSFRWRFHSLGSQKGRNYIIDTKLSKEDAADGEQCVSSKSRKKGCVLRTSDNAISIPEKDFNKAFVEFYWKTSDPGCKMQVCLMANKDCKSYFKKEIKAPDSNWNRYSIPISDFCKHEKFGRIKEISGIRFLQSKNMMNDVVFKIDAVKLFLSSSNGLSAKEVERVEALRAFKESLANIKKKCFSKTLVDDLDGVYNEKSKWLNRISSNKKEIKAKKTPVPPIIDGKLDDQCWKNAIKTDCFKDFKEGRTKIEETYSKLAYDDKNLYVAFFCKADKWDKKDELVSGHDSGILVNDCVEVFLQPDRTCKKYYHFASNLLGSKIDQKRDAGVVDRAWNSNWKVKTFRAASFWTVEICIPFASLGGDAPKQNVLWGLNLCREYKPGSQIGSWACTYGGFHKPFLFGILNFQ